MKYTANCPACDYEFEIGGVAAALEGLKCPKCGAKFKPEKIHKTEPAPPPDGPIINNSTLQRCPDCGREVSRNAATCPQCGHVFKYAGGVNLKDPVHFIGLLLCIGFIIAVVVYILSWIG
jgi:uncharacterized paraquat-inducible protein A